MVLANNAAAGMQVRPAFFLSAHARSVRTSDKGVRVKIRKVRLASKASWSLFCFLSALRGLFALFRLLSPLSPSLPSVYLPI
jgi:hypothetical protein